jgi:hypothetical protein
MLQDNKSTNCSDSFTECLSQVICAVSFIWVINRHCASLTSVAAQFPDPAAKIECIEPTTLINILKPSELTTLCREETVICKRFPFYST